MQELSLTFCMFRLSGVWFTSSRPRPGPSLVPTLSGLTDATSNAGAVAADWPTAAPVAKTTRPAPNITRIIPLTLLAAQFYSPREIIPQRAFPNRRRFGRVYSENRHGKQARLCLGVHLRTTTFHCATL